MLDMGRNALQTANALPDDRETIDLNALAPAIKEIKGQSCIVCAKLYRKHGSSSLRQH